MEWTSQSTWGEPLSGWRFDDVAFSGDTLVAAHQTGFVLRIPAWTGAVERVNLPVGGAGTKLRCLAFTGDGTTGYLGLLRTDAQAGGVPRLFTTADGGVNWQANDPVDAAGSAIGPWHGLCGLSAIGDTVWAVGTYLSHTWVSGREHEADAIVSHDRGVTWRAPLDEEDNRIFEAANSLIDVYFNTPAEGLIVGQTAQGVPGIWTTGDGGCHWSSVALPDAALTEARCWKIGRDGYRVAVTVASKMPNTRLLVTEDFRDPDGWSSIVVDIWPGEIMDHQLAGIAWLNGIHWIGINANPAHESVDLLNWSQSQLSGAGGSLSNVNRIIRGPDGCLYAAGSNLYRYA